MPQTGEAMEGLSSRLMGGGLRTPQMNRAVARSIYTYPPTGKRWQISTGGGEKPIWSPKGDELFYINGSTYMVSSFIRQPTLIAGKPQLFLEGSFVNVPGRTNDIDPNGHRLLLIREAEQSSAMQIRVVSNWFEELEQKVPTR